jgi:hypothetical protein
MDDIRALINDLESKAASRIGKGGQHVRVEGQETEEDDSTVADRKAVRRGRTPAQLVS